VARIYGRLLKDFGFLSDGDIIEVKPSDLIGSAVGESSTKTAAILESAKGKVLFIDEAYGLDPSRSTSYGGQVIDTLVERIDGNAGVDMAVILAGYEPQMRALFKNANNQGFTRRFNLDEAFQFEDFSDNDLKKVLLSLLRRENLRAGLSTVTLAVSLMSQRRRLDGFGNAAECSIILDRAKLHLASRKQAAADLNEKRQRMLKDLENGSAQKANPHKRGGAKLKSSASQNYDDEGKDGDHEEDDPSNQIPDEADCVCDPYLLIDEDFIKVETSAKNAREAFSDLENMEHVMELLQDMEDTLNQAKKDGLSAAKILEDCHMIFTGPPGTGKTTVAQRFGTMFRQLELLPTDHVEVVTAANLISRYVGNTGPNVVEAMRKAKGGILFVDEAYGMVPKGGSASFGAEAIQAFIDNVTLPEFLGNIIIIFAGYQDDVEQLFGVNPGFRSRFDKRRLLFPSWTAEMAARATIKSAEKDHGYGVSDEGKEVLLDMYRQLIELPDWGSAREVYKVILPAMYSKRARRLAKKQRLENVVSEETGEEPAKPKKVVPPNRRAQAKAKEAKSDIPPYEASDIREAFAEPIKYRGGDDWNEMMKTGKLNAKPKIPAGSAGPPKQPSTGGGGEASGGEKIDRDAPSAAPQVEDDNFAPIITSITTTSDLQKEVEHAKKDRVLLVVSFTATWVTESFELPDFATKYKKVRFSLVSHSDETRPVFDECGVKEMRVFLLYLNGKMVERVLDKFSLMCLRIGYWMKKQTSEVLFGGPSEGGMTLNADGQRQENQNHNHKTVEKKAEKTLTKNAGEGGAGKDIWAALEEACQELGYSLETVADFLESGDYPEELLALIKRKVKSDDTSAVVEMLNSQRGSVLKKIKQAIIEIKR
jgi:DNA polymerase III delta prime subunit